MSLPAWEDLERMIHLKTFLISAPLLGLFYHWVAIEPMPWWPDTAIMGTFMGAMAVFVLMRAPFLPIAAARVWRAGRSAVRFDQ